MDTNPITKDDVEYELRNLIHLNLIHNHPIPSDNYESLINLIMKNIPESILSTYLPYIENPDPLSPFIEDLISNALKN